MPKRRVLSSPFLFVCRNIRTREIFAVTSVLSLADETGIPYSRLRRIFNKEMQEMYIGFDYEIWRMSIQDIIMRKRGRMTRRSSMSNRRY